MDTSINRLEVRVHGKAFECQDGDVIGRNGTVGQELFSNLEGLAERHVLIGRNGLLWFLLIPRNVKEPALLDGEPAEHGVRHPLEHSHHLRIGSTTLHFSVVVETQSSSRTNDEEDECFGSMAGAVAALDSNFFEMLANNVHDLVAVIDAKGRRLWNNAAYATVLGYTPADMQGTDSTVEIHPDDQPLVKKTFVDSMITEKGSRIEYRMRHREGRWVFLESDGVVLSNWQGVGKCLVIIARDVTARKRAEYEIRKRNQRQRAQSAVLAKFASATEFHLGDLPVCLAMLTEAIVDMLQCERAAVWLMNAEAGRLMCADLFINGKPEHSTGEDSLALADIPHYLQSLQSVRTLIAAQAIDHPALRELSDTYLSAHEIVTKLDVPIRRGTDLLGVLSCEGTHQHEWTIDEQSFVTALADLFLLAYETQERMRTYQALQESQQQLAAETAEAARYVLSLLPGKLTGDISTDWLFIPSEQLGGDAFGYHWLDDDHLAIYLLDVVGHGVGAALLSVTALNVFRNQGLPNIDFHDPAAVLVALNASFEMDEQNEMYFTAWYGVFHRPSRTLRFSAAGHPPAILFTGDAPAAATMVELKAPGLMIGAVAGAGYVTQSTTLGAYGKLYVFSDGAYEVSRRDGSAMSFEEFTTILAQPPASDDGDLAGIVERMREIQGAKMLPDDCSLMKLVFN
ncbi:MAG: SpoIIE family protein phosphatase [Chthoniobacter sp.]|uniref:SpoIIE family protein phosphatase n=1 Tax=Chthoniobacter sp. TaxID=2510640 RepID=UPI0032AD7ECA